MYAFTAVKKNIISAFHYCTFCNVVFVFVEVFWRSAELGFGTYAAVLSPSLFDILLRSNHNLISRCRRCMRENYLKARGTSNICMISVSNFCTISISATKLL